MNDLNILVIGGGIGGLTAAIALRRKGHRVTVIEKDPDWSVYGVGIIQQSNVIRAMSELDLLDDYLAAGVPFDTIAIHTPDGTKVAEIPGAASDRRNILPMSVSAGRPCTRYWETGQSLPAPRSVWASLPMRSTIWVTGFA